jgi:RNA polymerase sigma factor (sigma-70 family)
MKTAADEATTLASSDLGSLYEDYWPSLLRTAWMMTGSKDEAEDIVHDAFVRLASRPHLAPEHPLAYLRQIVVNQVRDRRRRAVVQLRYRQSPSPPVLGADDGLVWQLFQKLPLRQRQVLVLRYHDNLTLAEISELLRWPLGTTKSLAHRGLERLRKEMGADD